MNKVYIAGPFFDAHQLRVIKNIEHTLEKADIEYFSPRILGNISDNKGNAEFAEKIFDANINGILHNNCTLVVIDGFDPGTMVELGYAYSIKRIIPSSRRIITYSAKDYGLNVMLAQMSDCHVTDINNLVDAIKGDYHNKAESTT